MKRVKSVDEAEVRVRQAARLMALGALRATEKHEERRRKQQDDCHSERESGGVHPDSRVYIDMIQRD